MSEQPKPTLQDWANVIYYAEEHASEFTNPPAGDDLIAQTVTEKTEQLVAKYNAAVLDRINQLFNR